MKMNKATKKKMAKQRLKRKIAFYNAYNRGDVVRVYEIEPKFRIIKYNVLSKHQLGNSYYFLVSDQKGKMSIQKVVYNGCAGLMEVLKTSKRYIENKEVFESWIEKEKTRRLYRL